MFRRIVVALFLAGLFLAEGLAQNSVSRMEQVIQFYVANHEFMGSVLVARDGEVILNKGYGFANMEWRIPNSPTTKFRLGSVSKQFTAACILLLEERGKLKLDDPVKKYVPDAPAAWDKITIYHLLTHTSGIPDYSGWDSTTAQPTTTEKIIARLREQPLDFPPGENYHYSNGGYAVLGYVIEKASQQSYAQFVQENIFNRLGMTNSGYDSNAKILPERASGYTPGFTGMRNAAFTDMSWPFSAGGLYSTTEDLLRWEEDLMGGKLLSAASLQKMITPFKSFYAFGLRVSVVDGHMLICHNGGISGFNTRLSYYPEDKLTVVVLANVQGDAPWEIANNLGSIAHGENVVLRSERKQSPVSRSILEKYVGTYTQPWGPDAKITVEDGQLMIQSTWSMWQPKVPLMAESDTMFILKNDDTEVEFVRNDKDDVPYIIVHRDGRDMKLTRK